MADKELKIVKLSELGVEYRLKYLQKRIFDINNKNKLNYECYEKTEIDNNDRFLEIFRQELDKFLLDDKNFESIYVAIYE